MDISELDIQALIEAQKTHDATVWGGIFLIWVLLAIPAWAEEIVRIRNSPQPSKPAKGLDKYSKSSLWWCAGLLVLFLGWENHLHPEPVGILLAILTILFFAFKKYKQQVLKYLIDMPRSHRVCAVSCSLWFVYAALRTTTEFLGFQKWDEDFFFINLLAPPILIWCAYMAFIWIRKGKCS